MNLKKPPDPRAFAVITESYLPRWGRRNPLQSHSQPAQPSPHSRPTFNCIVSPSTRPFRSRDTTPQSRFAEHCGKMTVKCPNTHSVNLTVMFGSQPATTSQVSAGLEDLGSA